MAYFVDKVCLSRFLDLLLWPPFRKKGVNKKIETIIMDSSSIHLLLKNTPQLAAGMVRKLIWGGEFWSDGGYVGTVGDGVTADIIRNYVEKQGTKEEKDAYKQMNLLEFE